MDRKHEKYEYGMVCGQVWVGESFQSSRTDHEAKLKQM